jgi:hypothetical protein
MPIPQKRLAGIERLEAALDKDVEIAAQKRV